MDELQLQRGIKFDYGVKNQTGLAIQIACLSTTRSITIDNQQNTLYWIISLVARTVYNLTHGSLLLVTSSARALLSVERECGEAIIARRIHMVHYSPQHKCRLL